jgi:hypothetical protein
VIGGNLRSFITDFRYVEQAAGEVDPGFDRRQAQQDLLEDVPSVLPEEPLRLAFEEAHVTVRQYKQMRGLFADRVELVGLNGMVERYGRGTASGEGAGGGAGDSGRGRGCRRRVSAPDRAGDRRADRA